MLERQQLRQAALFIRNNGRRARVTALRFWRDPQKRDRATAAATFAFIAAFALGSVDAVVTGGADWAPGEAYASEPVVRAVSAPITFTDVEAPPALVAVAADAADYRYTSEVLLGGPEQAAPVGVAGKAQQFLAYADGSPGEQVPVN